MASREQLARALWRIDALPYGQARTAAAERVVAETEAGDHQDLLAVAYNALITAYEFGAEKNHDKILAPFSKVLRLYDTRPELFDDNNRDNLLWQFKWIPTQMWRFPTVPRQQIDDVIAVMRRYFAEAGAGMSAVLDIEWSWAWHRGDWETADGRFADFRASPRDRLTDCEACVRSRAGSYLVQRGRIEEGLAEYRRVIERRYSCVSEPHYVLAGMLIPLVKCGRLDEARDMHIKGLALIRGSDSNLSALGTHLAFLARTGNARRGLDLIVEHLDLLHDARTPSNRCEALTDAVTVLDRITADGGGDTPVPATRSGSPETVATLARHWREDARELAAAFDDRNATSHWTNRLMASLAAGPLVDIPLALGTPARHG